MSNKKTLNSVAVGAQRVGGAETQNVKGFCVKMQTYLELAKFICFELWPYLFGHSIKNLK